MAGRGRKSGSWSVVGQEVGCAKDDYWARMTGGVYSEADAAFDSIMAMATYAAAGPGPRMGSCWAPGHGGYYARGAAPHFTGPPGAAGGCCVGCCKDEEGAADQGAAPCV